MELEIKNKGFTLVELLVAMVVFTLIVMIVGNIAVSVIRGQRKAIVIQNSQEAGRFLLETMAKEIRASVINTGSGNGLTLLDITNRYGNTLDYQFDNSNKRLLRDGQIASPSNIDITGGFYIREYSFPAAPARKVVTIVMKIEVISTKIEERVEINLQNTIASRVY